MDEVSSLGGVLAVERRYPCMRISFRIQSREGDAFAIRRKIELTHRNAWQNRPECGQ
jgi:hypothetical protein